MHDMNFLQKALTFFHNCDIICSISIKNSIGLSAKRRVVGIKKIFSHSFFTVRTSFNCIALVCGMEKKYDEIKNP